MNRRNFLRGALALPLAAVGAPERFLVGRYGVPAGFSRRVTAAIEAGWRHQEALSMFAMFSALPHILNMMEAEVQKVKEPIMKEAIRALAEAVPCGEPS